MENRLKGDKSRARKSDKRLTVVQGKNCRLKKSSKLKSVCLGD